MDQLPGITKPSVFDKKVVIEAITLVPAFIAAAVAARLNYLDPSKRTEAYVLGITAVLLLFSGIWRMVHAHRQDKKEKAQKDFDGLNGAIHVLYSNIKNHLQFKSNEPGLLRATIHRVVYGQGSNDPKTLQQLVPYVGGDGGEYGREFSVSQGIIGTAVRNKEARFASRKNEDYATYLEELCQRWGYNERTAQQLKQDRVSWLAVPILNNNKIPLAVVYLDSSVKNAFDRVVLEKVISSCAGISSYITERYALSTVPMELKPGSGGASQIAEIIEVSSAGSVLVENRVVLTDDSQQALTSSAASIDLPPTSSAPSKA